MFYGFCVFVLGKNSFMSISQSTNQSISFSPKIFVIQMHQSRGEQDSKTQSELTAALDAMYIYNYYNSNNSKTLF